MSDSTFLTHITLTNYKSIARCSVELHPLMFLVGPNGAGKSNFLDALRFVSDALNTSLDHAIRQRGGIQEILHRAEHPADNFSTYLDFHLSGGATGYYSFHVKADSMGGYEVLTETCSLRTNTRAKIEKRFRVHNGEVESSEPVTPAVATDRLYLVAASGLPAFRPVYDALAHMAFYNLNLAWIRDTQPPDARELLSHDGDNITSVLARMSKNSPDAKRRIEEYLAAVVPGVEGVDVKDIGLNEMLEFRQRLPGVQQPLTFPGYSMSDGTLRALCILVAMFQTGNQSGKDVSLVGIEEPEIALHPAALGALLDAMEEASETKQILITSHSADLLDRERIPSDSLLAVVSEQGKTVIAPIDAASRKVLRDHLFTAGELLRLNQLAPNREALQPDETDKAAFLDENAA
ncbi:MAG TPA: AAA family ATPase [Chthonomonadaceae bacterium]|nr:AAA family ATPase [Chthonomonadaceae bacterium]